LIEPIGCRKGPIIPENYARSDKVCGLHMQTGEFECEDWIEKGKLGFGEKKGKSE